MVKCNQTFMGGVQMFPGITQSQNNTKAVSDVPVVAIEIMMFFFTGH